MAHPRPSCQGGDQLTQSELAAQMGIEEPTLVGLLRRLENDGWIKRHDASHDRRCKNVHLARKSSPILREIFATARQLRHELHRRYLGARFADVHARADTHPRTSAEVTDIRNSNGRRVSNKKAMITVTEMKGATRERVTIWSAASVAARFTSLPPLRGVLLVVFAFAHLFQPPKGRGTASRRARSPWQR